MVEEAVSYNELDYISVSAGGGEAGGEQRVSAHLSGCRDVSSNMVGCFCGALCPWGVFWPLSSCLRYRELKVLPHHMPPLWMPSLFVSLHGQQSSC